MKPSSWVIFIGFIVALTGRESIIAEPSSEPEWIWQSSQDNSAGHTVFLRKSFLTPPYLWNARLFVSADDHAEIFLNGISVAVCERWNQPIRMEVTVRLNQGENLIAIRAQNDSGMGGVIVQLRLGGATTIVSDSSWLASTREESGWNALPFNAAHWNHARSLGKHGMQPWGEILNTASATPAERLKVPQGFQVELLRSAQPGEGSWVCAAFDDRGRLLMAPQESDRPMLRLSFKDGHVAVIEPMAPTLRQAMGLVWSNGGLYANANGPQGTGLYRAQDANGDDRIDETEVRLLVGYKGGSEHGYHAVRIGPDGQIYVLNGNGTKLPEPIASTSPHRNYAEDVLALDPVDNAMSQPAGYILRGNPKGENWELWLGGLRNTYDFDFNPDGELFCFDSDMEWDWGAPWYRPTRIVHGVSGGEFGWREDRRTWPEYREDSLPAVVDVGIGSPTGVEFGTRSAFPEKYRRALFAMDWSYGRIFAVHLTSVGASYQGEVETFLRGTPLNVTDLSFGPDGAMYFITGGRATQSGLYRVRYLTNSALPFVQPGLIATEPESNKSARALRHRLESFHGRKDAAALGDLWPHLGSSDRHIRYAARVALESQPIARWQERALNESDDTARLTALLALARLGSADIQPSLLRAVARTPLSSNDLTNRLLEYLVLEISFVRQGRPGSEDIRLIGDFLSRRYPAPSWPENRELVRLLSWLGTSDIVPKTLHLLQAAETQEEQLHYIEQLRRVKTGWTPEERRTYFSWWTAPRNLASHPPELIRWFSDVDRRYVDGAWMDRFRNEFRSDAIATLSDPERTELAPMLDKPVFPAQLVPRTNRPLVQEWTMNDLVPHLRETEHNRNFERGRQAFVEAQCLACHRFGNDGGSLGPELTAIGTKYDRRSLLESILEPSKAINEQYQSTTVVLRGGEILTGRMVRETAQKIEIETNPYGGPSEEVERKNIEQIRPSRSSPMPEGLVNSLSRDEILDLIAYLTANGQPTAASFAEPSPRNKIR